MNLKVYLIFLLLFIYGCNANYHFRKGNKEFVDGRYSKAIKHFEKSNKKAIKPKHDSLKLKLASKLTESYYKVNNNKRALSWSKKLYRLSNKSDSAKLLMANNFIRIGKIENANELIDEVLKTNSDSKLATKLKHICKINYDWVANPTRFSITPIKKLNSSKHDYKAEYLGDDTTKVIMASTRAYGEGKKKKMLISKITGFGHSNIFIAKRKPKRSRRNQEEEENPKLFWKKPKEIRDSLNTEFDEGAVSVSEDGETIYFSSNRPNDDDEIFGVKIYSFSLTQGYDKNNKEYDKCAKVKYEKILNDSISAAHPAISGDELTMLFVSDMPGGFGGNDIWKVTRSSKTGKWGKPENLGKEINTSGNEMFPYFRNDKEIYFSSDTHVGLGGLDIFKAIQNGGKWKVENMKSPINSFADDFGISFMQDAEKGLMTSSRYKGRDNIYEFEYHAKIFRLIVFVKDETSDIELPEVRLKLLASDGTEDIFETDEGGNATITLKPELDYLLVVSKNKYLNNKIKVSTKALNDSKNFIENIKLVPIEKTINLPNIFYDFASWTLKEESKKALDILVKTLEDNPNISIELLSHSDMVGEDKANLELSQKRAQSVVEYLVSKGINQRRLKPVGYGEKQPKVVDRKVRKKFPEFRDGDVLNEKYINQLGTEELKEKANQINRRTEFKVISTNFR